MPTQIMSFFTPGIARAVALQGNYAYIADEESGLRIANISNPASPTAAGFFDTFGRTFDVAVSGHEVFITDDEEGLRVIDVTDTTEPAIIGYYDTPGNATGIVLINNLAYIGDGAYFGIYDCSTVLSAPEQIAVAPAEFLLLSAYPNPFNPVTTISFELARRGNVQLGIYNTNGQLVTTLANDVLDAGAHAIEFDGSGRASGTYFVTLRQAEQLSSAKLVLLK
jgi:hypothetical protein